MAGWVIRREIDLFSVIYYVILIESEWYRGPQTLSHEGVSAMIKSKGVCDVCHTEFDLEERTFGFKITEDSPGSPFKKWTVTISSCVDGCLEEGLSHACGLACLYRAISEVVDKKAEEADFRIIGYEGADDRSTRVVDLRDRKTKKPPA